MPAEKKSRAAARKIKDKWKAKVWYNLLAPDMFNKQLLGETPTDTPDKLIGRIAEVTVQDLTGDFSKMHIKLLFRVNQVQGQDALTQFVGHDMTSDYIRRLTRRKRTRTDLTVDVTTKDNWHIRVKPMAITDRRIQSSKQRVIRAIMTKIIADTAAKQSVGEFVKGIISGDLAKAIALGCKPIHPVSRVEVRKSEVSAAGEVSTEAITAAAPAAEEKPVETPAEIPAAEPAAPAPTEPKPEEPTPEELPPEELKSEDSDEL
jgi:small subunit ribosomal protein S3Ae